MYMLYCGISIGFFMGVVLEYVYIKHTNKRLNETEEEQWERLDKVYGDKKDWETADYLMQGR